MKTDRTYIEREKRWLLALACLTAFALCLFPSAPTPQAAGIQQKGFSSPDEAVKLLVEAIRGNDTKKMIAILGPGSRELISSGDDASDRAGREKFLTAYDQMHSFQKDSANRMVLCIGSDNWPLPIPIVKKGRQWIFDTIEGRQEILNRRIGRNELHVMELLHAYVEAQHKYACSNYSGSGLVEFAGRIVSSDGKRDGLYWNAEAGEKESPLGPLVAQAAKEGYANPELSPFHGYYFRILTGQGKDAKGGAYSYLVKGKMLLGFALVAYPAEYGNSGIMTFIVNQEGAIYQKDLGKKTKNRAEAMTIFNPDRSWKKAKETTGEKQ
ncbi:MAG: DUF2950 domain-containing protein [Thermodesulfovibrionales bacterium]|jgi:hypothetical protein